MIDKNLMPRCSYKTESCLMSVGGLCRGLSETRFKGKRCPFYKDVRCMTIKEIREYLNGIENGFKPKYGG